MHSPWKSDVIIEMMNGYVRRPEGRATVSAVGHRQQAYLQTFAAKAIAVLAVRVVVSADVDTFVVAGAGGVQVAGPLDTILALDTGCLGGRHGVVLIRNWRGRRRRRFLNDSYAVNK